jgi:hypothetical protein
MEQERIRELLDKYYEGQTSAEEEAQLRSFLADPAESSSLGAEFGYLAGMSPEVPEPSEDFYARLEAVTHDESETMPGMAPRPGTTLRSVFNSRSGVLPPAGMTPLRGEPLQTRMTPRRNRLRYAMSIAAAAAVVTGAYLIFDYTGRLEMKDTYKDPEIALAEVRSILMTVSDKMTSGTEPLGSINSMNIAPATLEGLGKINSAVGENLSRLRYLDRVTGSQKNKENN